MQEPSRARDSAPPSPSGSLSSAWDKGAELATLTAALDSVRTHIARINDPDLGAVGLDFINQLSRTACAHSPTQDPSCNAAYQSFVYPPDPGTTGFRNHIAYGPRARANGQLLFSAHIHEGLHALQKAAAPALHASPYNPMTNIVLCPGDWVAAQERCEQDAYVKQAWMNSLLAIHDASVYHTSRPDPMDAGMFSVIRQAWNGNIFLAMQHAAKTVLDRNIFIQDPAAGGPVTTFADHYHTVALENYGRIIATRLRDNGPNLVFVRMEPDDILAIGQGFGPNPFARGTRMKCGHDFSGPGRLSPGNKKTLHDLNIELGIADDRSLPTLREALAATGMTRAAFLSATYAGKNRRPTPPPEFPAP